MNLKQKTLKMLMQHGMMPNQIDAKDLKTVIRDSKKNKKGDDKK